ncbi:respiratory nitrate reductase subunit alpha [Klebsiella oxytoca]|nr:respiratory nitrate reductase subunit alpha [Klebsiella oxytoca]
MALAMGHVMLREFHLDKPSQYFTDYVRRYTDMPMLVMLEERDGYYAAGRMLRAADLVDALGQETNPEWKTVAFDEKGRKSPYRTVLSVSAGATKVNGILNSATVKPAKMSSYA